MRYTGKWPTAMERDQSYSKDKSSDLAVCVRKDFLLRKGMKTKPKKPTKDPSDCETSDPAHPTSALLEEVQMSWGDGREVSGGLPWQSCGQDCCFTAGAQVQSLVSKLRPHSLCHTSKNNNKKEKWVDEEEKPEILFLAVGMSFSNAIISFVGNIIHSVVFIGHLPVTTET